jgi:hypothetical protein
MPMFAPATDKAEYELPEPNRYIAVCLGIEDAPDKGYGPGVKWVFQLIDPMTNLPIKDSQGRDFQLWQFTSVSMGRKARARPIIEALMGRELVEGEVPDSRLLLNKGMICLVAHEKDEKGNLRARVTSCSPYNPAPDASRVSIPATAPAPAPGFDANGNTVSVNGTDKAALVQKFEKARRSAEVLGTPKHLDWLAMDPATMSADDLVSVTAAINVELTA